MAHCVSIAWITVRQIEAHPLRFHHKLFHFLLQQPLAVAGARRRQFRHDGSDPGPSFEPAFLNQVLDHFVRGIGMDLELGRQRPDRRKRLARPEIRR